MPVAHLLLPIIRTLDICISGLRIVSELSRRLKKSSALQLLGVEVAGVEGRESTTTTKQKKQTTKSRLLFIDSGGGGGGN